MAALLQVVALLPLFLVSTNAYQVKNPDISLLEPQGIRFAYPDEPSITLVAFHYSINKPVEGVAAGDYNYDVNTKTGAYWVHENTNVVVQSGDVVYYWVYVLKAGAGYTLTDQSWTDAEPSQAPTTTTKPPTNPTSTASTTLTTVTTVSDPPVTNPSGETAPPNGGGVPSQCSMYPCDSSCDSSSPPCNGLIFQEEFNSLNLDIWEHEITAGGGGNWEFQYYTNNRSNSYVKDGKLFIKPTLTEDLLGPGSVTNSRLDLWGASPANLCTGNAWWGCDRTGTADNILNPIQSARLRTVDSFSFKYGRLEVEAKLPTGDWLWPAIWLLPTRNAYGTWPASGEIDLVESRGNANMRYGDESAGVDQMGSTMHWGPFWPLNGYPKTHATKNLPDGQTFGSGFHKYALDWTMDSMKFYVDDEEILSVDPGSGFWEFGEFAEQAPDIGNPWEHSSNKFTPFDQEFYLILNVAVGGVNYFGDTATYDPPKPWTNDSPTASRDFWNAKDDWLPTWNGEEAAMQVNYVRVYAQDGQTTYHLRDR
nr:beta-1,3-glucan-binding protein-like isoform X1 [Lytechinus pictus]